MKYVVLVVLVLFVAAGGLTFAHRWAYGSFPWDGGPDRLQWCDRRYYLSPPNERVGRDRPLTPILNAPPLIGDRVYAVRPTCGGKYTELILYRSVGDGEYALYELSLDPPFRSVGLSGGRIEMTS